MLVLSPLFIPVAVTVAPWLTSESVASLAALGLHRPARSPRLTQKGHAMTIEFTALQRETLTAIVDTFVASVPREDDPDGFYAAKGSDVGADVAAEQYLLTRLPDEQLAGTAAADRRRSASSSSRISPRPAARRSSPTSQPSRPRRRGRSPR